LFTSSDCAGNKTPHLLVGLQPNFVVLGAMYALQIPKWYGMYGRVLHSNSIRVAGGVVSRK
jgi:hypothetical protein